MSSNDVLGTLRKLEQSSDIISELKAGRFSSWIAVKIALFTSTLNDVKVDYPHKKKLFSFAGFILIVISTLRYWRYVFDSKPKDLFLGASSGLFRHEGKVLDSYFPYADVDLKSVIYMLNSADFDHLRSMKVYFKEHQIVSENFLIGPFKVLFSLLLSPMGFILKNRKLENAQKTASSSFSIPLRRLRYIHYKFLVGFAAFWCFFKLLKIKRAFIVSAYTKSDAVAALRALGIEVIEIQHGLIGSEHIGYNYASKNPLLPTPDKIYVYNSFWKRELVKAGYFGDSQVKITGRLKYDLVNSSEAPNLPSYIIFTGQGAFYDAIVDFVLRAQTELAAAKIDFIYKPHPREAAEDLADLERRLKQVSHFSIYKGASSTELLIKEALAHVSVFSSCHFDAIHFLNRTFVLDIMPDNILNSYCKDHPSQYVKVKELSDVIGSMKDA